MNRTARASARRAAALCVALAALAHPAAAGRQDGAADDEASQVRSEALLHERGRELLHPGDPLVLIGREEGDNDLRSRTPALKNSDRAAAQRDPDELYRRALAMYEERATFRQPAPRVVAPPEATPRADPRPGAGKEGARKRASEPSWWPWVLVFLVTSGVSLWILKRVGAIYLETDGG